jgi:hypothetical protein
MPTSPLGSSKRNEPTLVKLALALPSNHGWVGAHPLISSIFDGRSSA